MKIKRRCICPTSIVAVALSIVCATHSVSFAQSTYQRLALRYNRPSIYLSTFTLPNPSQNNVYLTSTFRISYPMLSFKKLNEPGKSTFYATPMLRLELFKSPQKDLPVDKEISLVDLASAGRSTWSDTVYAANYKTTKSLESFAKGFIQMKVTPNSYTYALHFSEKGSDREITAKKRISVKHYSKDEQGEVILVGKVEQTGNQKRLNLLNIGHNVFFGKDFYAFVHLPDFSSENNYRVKIDKVRISKQDTVSIKTVFKKTISRSQIITQVYPKLSQNNDKLYLNLQQNAKGFTYAVIKVPNSTFSDAIYKIEITRDDKTIAQKVYHTLWLDKPISLYSTDLAIKMLHFIVDQQTIEHIESGSAEAQKEKLDAFWEKRDPSPQTAFNELKAEYYGRIDYAYNHFSSPGVLGFKDGRGRIYILYGPPKDIERVYPKETTVREIWTYKNQRFVFKATSGYGNFKLISK